MFRNLIPNVGFGDHTKKEKAQQIFDAQLETANNKWFQIRRDSQNSFTQLEQRLRNGKNGRGRFMVTMRRNLFLPTTEKVRKVIIDVAKDLLNRIDALKTEFYRADTFLNIPVGKLKNLLNRCSDSNTLQCYDEELSKHIVNILEFFHDNKNLKLDTNSYEGGRSRRRKLRGRKARSQRIRYR